MTKGQIRLTLYEYASEWIAAGYVFPNSTGDLISIYEKKAEDFRLHFPGRAVTMYSLRKTMEEKREIGRKIPTDKNDHWTEVTRPDDGISDFSEAVEQMKINNQTEDRTHLPQVSRTATRVPINHSWH